MGSGLLIPHEMVPALISSELMFVRKTQINVDELAVTLVDILIMLTNPNLSNKHVISCLEVSLDSMSILISPPQTITWLFSREW